MPRNSLPSVQAAKKEKPPPTSDFSEKRFILNFHSIFPSLSILPLRQEQYPNKTSLVQEQSAE